MYSAQLLDHFEHPRNVGVLTTPDAVAQCENPVCGDVLKLSARITDDKIIEIRFQAKGCVPAMACGSAITELVSGPSPEEASLIRKSNLIRAVSELPPASGHAADLAISTLKALLAQLRAASAMSQINATPLSNSPR